MLLYHLQNNYVVVVYGEFTHYPLLPYLGNHQHHSTNRSSSNRTQKYSTQTLTDCFLNTLSYWQQDHSNS